MSLHSDISLLCSFPLCSNPYCTDYNSMKLKYPRIDRERIKKLMGVNYIKGKNRFLIFNPLSQTLLFLVTFLESSYYFDRLS